MTSRIGVGVMVLCLLLYIVVVGQRAFLMLTTGDPIAIAIGVALVVMPLIGVWALFREMQFGFAADRLARTLTAEGRMPEPETPLTPSGRIARDDAAPVVARYAAEAEAAPEDWRSYFRLGVVQDAAGRRKDARASIREAIRLSRG